MADPVSVTLRDSVCVIVVDNPPVNAISQAVVDGLAAALEGASRDRDIRAIVLMGAGRTFIAGADIKALEDLAWGAPSGAPEMRPLLRQLEDSPSPVVVAMHGTALGGGLEVAMAGHYRVATPDARLGQPEVNLGIIPGAEGTQRLPRLVGIEQAIAMCVSGKPVTAADALRLGLIDHIIEGDLVDGAVAFAQDAASRGGPHPKTRERDDKLPSADALPALVAAGRELARKTRRRMEAPLAAVDAIEAAATLPFDEGCRREREIFIRAVASEQCKALIHAFFAERGAAKVPGVPKDARPAAIDRVAIVGAGTMGGGIAMAFANAGVPVRLAEANAEALERGVAAIRRNYGVSVERGRLTPAEMEQRLGRIQPQVGYDGFGDADLIVEAVFENLALKQQVFGEIDQAAPPGCVLATNTSTLDIDAIASATGRPAQVVGLHFFSPAHVMRLVEIVRGAATAPATIATAMAVTSRLRKVGVVVGNGPGFVGNRMMFPYMYEAQFLVEDGATPEAVDRALTGFGMAMGIFAVDDMAGLDVGWRVRQELGPAAAPKGRTPLVADRLCEMGRFGQKTGRGWYVYGADRVPAPDPEVIALIESLSAGAGIRRRTIGEAAIVERTIYGLVNEGARVLDEGLALRAADIDVIYVNGYGFPAWRGGPLFHADRVGLPRVLDRIHQFHREHGERWAPAPLLERLVRDGITFRAFDRARAGGWAAPGQP
jgi:3-hydroxyacyl-CoA dehydrogenase